MHKIVLIPLLVIALQLFAQPIPHPVYVEIRNSEGEIPLEGDITFQAWLQSNPNQIVTEDSVDCYYPAFGSFVKVNCGYFFEWDFSDIMMLSVTEISSNEQGWGAFQLTFDNAQIFAMDEGGIILGDVIIAPELEFPDQFIMEEDTPHVEECGEYIDGCFTYLNVSGGENIAAEVTGTNVLFTTPANWFGSEVMIFEVTGITGEVVADTVEVVVNSVNDIPTIILPDEFTFPAGHEAVVDFSPYLEDVDGDPLVLCVSGNENVNININDLEVTFSAIDGWHGSEEVVFMVDDCMGRPSDTVIINFRNPDDTILSCEDFQVDDGDTFIVPIWTTEIFEEWGAMYFTLILKFNPLILQYNSVSIENSFLNGTILGQEETSGYLIVAYAGFMDFSGVGIMLELEFTAICCGNTELDLETCFINDWDIRNLEDGQVAVNDIGIPHPPVADAGADIYITSGEDGLLDGSGSYDPNGDNITFLWTAPGEIIINNPTQEITQFTASQVNELTEYEIALSVFDGELTTIDHLILTVDYVAGTLEPDFPLVTELTGIYPNPFNPETTINFYLSEDSEVNISVYNLRGEIVTQLLNMRLTVGDHSIFWQAEEMPSGVYFLKMQTKDYTKINKLLLLK